MHHVGVGDRQDNARRARRQQAIHFVLQVNDVGLASAVVLGVHAVIGGQRDHRAERVELRPVAIHHRVERVGAIAARGELVLDIIGRGARNPSV